MMTIDRQKPKSAYLCGTKPHVVSPSQIDALRAKAEKQDDSLSSLVIQPKPMKNKKP